MKRETDSCNFLYRTEGAWEPWSSSPEYFIGIRNSCCVGSKSNGFHSHLPSILFVLCEQLPEKRELGRGHPFGSRGSRRAALREQGSADRKQLSPWISQMQHRAAKLRLLEGLRNEPAATAGAPGSPSRMQATPGEAGSTLGQYSRGGPQNTHNGYPGRKETCGSPTHMVSEKATLLTCPT